MKITYSTDTISAFGGLNFVNNSLEKADIFNFIDNSLSDRGLQSKYTYSDIVKSYLLMTLCGGECAEDITINLHKELKQVKDFNVSSADTLLRMQKELTTPKETFISESGVEHDFNINMKMNNLLVNLLVLTNQLDTNNKDYVLDYDNQFIPTDKYDSKRSYKKAEGYFPGIASINNLPVYIENRNGNSNVKYKQEETLVRTYKVLSDAGVKIKHSRMDCGSFTQKVVNVVESNSTYFYIRAQCCANLYEHIKEIPQWETAEIGCKKYEIASINYKPFGKQKEYRYVITREAKSNGQTDIFTQDSFIYRAIMTNNTTMSDIEVVKFYNQRAESERLFDEMNNDFLWKKMPFSFLQENTVFLIMMAICRNLFYFLTNFVSKKLDFIKPNYRLKKFIFRFMIVPAKWIKQGRMKVLKLFSDKKYHLLL